VSVVTIPEPGYGLADLFEISEEAAMRGLLLQRPVEVLGGLRLAEFSSACGARPLHRELGDAGAAGIHRARAALIG